jgi:hypothetical protein
VERSFSRRLFALLIASVFLLSWAGDALGYHPCPHHSWIAGAEQAHASGEHAHHAGHAAAALASVDDGQAPHVGQPAEHGACTCAGGCPSAADAPAESSGGLRVASTPGEPPRFGATERPGRRFDPFFLPYGQAPPLG